MEENEQKPTVFAVPYQMTVLGESSVRSKEEFWRFRTITNVIRQTPKQIENYKNRYKDNIN